MQVDIETWSRSVFSLLKATTPRGFRLEWDEVRLNHDREFFAVFNLSAEVTIEPNAYWHPCANVSCDFDGVGVYDLQGSPGRYIDVVAPQLEDRFWKAVNSFIVTKKGWGI
jgi:hypothetical protein